MIELNNIEHYIQKHILYVLSRQEFARYCEMRPEKTDSNLYAYHLGRLLASGYVCKTSQGYSLSLKGMQYIEYASSNINLRLQSKITTAIVLSNNDGEILLVKRHKQPFINYYGLPIGKVHSDKDNNINEAAERELLEKTGIKLNELNHIGDVYLKTQIKDTQISDIFAHVFYKKISKFVVDDDQDLVWANEKYLKSKDIIPGVREIIELSSSGKYFFKEIKIKI